MFLHNRYCATGVALEVDFDGLIESLKAREKTEGLRYYMDHDPQTFRMSRLYVEIKGADRDWAVGGNDNSALFDPTWGANVYRWKLCMIATLSKTGETVIAAYALLEEESVLAFEWVFRCMHETLVVPLRVVFSDHDSKIESALARMKDVWPHMLHFLCVFHLYLHLLVLYIYVLLYLYIFLRVSDFR